LSEAPRSSSPRILVVDDDEALSEMLHIVLGSEGFDARLCHTGDAAVGVFRDYHPDLVLLDLMLPGRDGVDVCREIRAESGVPIVMLTAKSDTIDVVDGLAAGADDYVAKPFKTQELIARIKTRLRRHVTPDSDVDSLRIGDLVIRVNEHTVRRGDTEITLTPLEFDLLLALARRLVDFDLTAAITINSATADSPLLWWAGGPRAMGVKTFDSLWLRLIDVGAALTARGYSSACDVVLDVVDPVCPWNQRTWRLTADSDGVATCVPTSDDADLRLPVQALGAAYLGSRSIAAQAHEGLVTELTAGSVRQLSRAMSRDREPVGAIEF